MTDILYEEKDRQMISEEAVKPKLILKWKKLHPEAQIPKYQNTGDAGFDFHALIQKDHMGSFNHIENDEPMIIIPAKSQFTVMTGLSCQFPSGWQMEIRPRSGLAFKKQITITNSPGTIDSLYKGHLMVILYNLGDREFIIKNGDRIAQGVMMPAPQFEMIEVEELDQNDRGGGFGSTGV
jgi:dUTP pyrophosphatase